MPSSGNVRGYFCRPLVFKSGGRCVASKHCQNPATHIIGWRFDKRILGVPHESVTNRPACEKHARLFAFKHDLEIGWAA